MSSFGLFLQKLIASKGISAAEFAKAIGASRSSVTGYLKDGVIPNTEKLRKISEVLGIPIEEIMAAKDVAPEITYLESRRAQKSSPDVTAMPVFEAAPATLSSIESYRDSPHDGPDFWLSIPQYRKCNYACRAKGDSMHPAIRNHALVGGRQIEDPSLIMFGDIYIIHTRNGIETIKYIHPHPDRQEMVLLVPYNKEAKVTPIERADIIRLYAAEFVINPL